MKYAVYVLTNRRNTVLYVGRSSNLSNRISIHKERSNKKAFSCLYNTNKLIYFEYHNSWEESYSREQKMKKWHREWKERLINYNNPEWKDLSDEI